MANKIPPAAKDTVYQIITGYWPEIASAKNWKSTRSWGTAGSSGAKYKLVSGYSDSAIKAAEFREMSQDE